MEPVIQKNKCPICKPASPSYKILFPKAPPRKSRTFSELKSKGEIKGTPHAGLIFSNDLIHAPFWGGKLLQP
jgi:hypothetical protein